MNRFHKIAFFLLAFCLLLSCSQKSDTIKIGAILPLTGDGARYGQSAKNGIELALSLINEVGGISGKSISIIYEDSQMLPREGINAINKLINIDKVQVIIGAMASSVTLSIAPIAEQNKIVLLSPASSTPEITEAGDYVFRNTYSDIYEGERMGKYAYNQLGFSQVAILHINNDFGVGLSNEFSNSFNNAGGEILINESYQQGVTDFRTQLTKIINVKPDAIYLVGYSEMGYIVRQMRELVIVQPIISCIMFQDPKILQIAGEAAEGIIYSYPSYNPDSDSKHISDFVSKYEKKFNEEPDIYAASAYDALNILAKAIDSNGIKSNDIKDGLYSIRNYPGVTGDTSFDKNGDVIKPIGIKKVNNRNFIWVDSIF